MQITQPVQREWTIERSRFIAILTPIKSVQDAHDILLQTRKEYYDASHVCFAMVIGTTQHCSDDGEPSSTAGRPILERLVASGLTNALLMVVRYFGGIKLGTAGLREAYGESARLVLADCEMLEEVQMHVYHVQIDYALFGKLQATLLSQYEVLDTHYGEQVECLIATQDPHFENTWVSLTNGNHTIQHVRDEMRLIPITNHS